MKYCKITALLRKENKFFFHLQGHYVRDLGDSGDKDTENEVLLLEHDIPHQPFSQQVLNDLPKMPWIITEQVRDA